MSNETLVVILILAMLSSRSVERMLSSVLDFVKYIVEKKEENRHSPN